MKQMFQQRIEAIKKELRRSGEPAALVLSSAPARVYSRDTLYPYRQDSDFYYLTGSLAKDLVLLVSSEFEKPLLFAPEIDPVQVLWEGKPPSYRAVAQRMGAQLVITSDAAKDVTSKIRKHRNLYFQNIPGSLAWRIAEQLLKAPSHGRAQLPSRFFHSDVLLEPLRLYKSKAEIHLIREAAKITAESVRAALPFLQAGAYEFEVAARIDYEFRIRRAGPSFATIAASGPSAATLHYEEHSRRLRNEELFLLDCGAAFEMYAADITRVFPVGGRFTPIQREVYQIVLDAQRAAIATIRHNIPIQRVYDAAAEQMVEGLRALNVLKGSTRSLMKQRAYREFFPHGIGHPLGLDVHDIGNLRNNNEPRLKKGMVFTVEPGLYFSKPIRGVPAMGIRIEDDVLVTERGCTILTPELPKDLDEVEALFAE